MGRLNVIQLDSIPIIIRTQHLPFHSRLGPYRPELIDDVAYARDEWFEAWAHEASLLPVESEPLFRWTHERARNGQTWKSLAEVARREPGYVQSVLDEVRERGAVAGGELSDPRPLPGDGSGWWHRSLGVLALDWLFRVGELGVRRRGNFEKVFSPLEATIPDAVRAVPNRALRMFDFDYRIEIYVPEAKRRWGYYVLPIMVDGQLVARSCIKTDREAGVLRIRTSWAEEGHADAETAERVRPALLDLAALVGVDTVEIQPVGDLAPHLAPLF